MKGNVPRGSPMPQKLPPDSVPRRRDRLAAWGGSAFLAMLVLTIAWRFVEPPPPSEIRIAAGDREGAYYHFANRYQALLAEEGIALGVVETAGAVENIERLESGDASIGFVQGGVLAGREHPRLEALASVYFEPLWLFYRGDADIADLADLAGKTVAIGEDRSGTQRLALELLRDNGIDGRSAELYPLGGDYASRQLLDGSVDAAFFIGAPTSATVQQLLREKDIRLLSFRRHQAYRARHRFLSSVTLGEGMFDLAENLPPRDVILLAPTAALVARKDLHPALVAVLMKVATTVHRDGGLLAEDGEFPSVRFTELPVRDEARLYLESGPSFLNRYLPFWAASWIDRLKILILPLLTLLIPLLRLAPPLYAWRIRKRIYRWYQVLRDIEHPRPDASGKSLLERLDDLEDEVIEIEVPLGFMDEVYHLRAHIDLMRKRLLANAGAQLAADTDWVEPPSRVSSDR